MDACAGKITSLNFKAFKFSSLTNSQPGEQFTQECNDSIHAYFILSFWASMIVMVPLLITGIGGTLFAMSILGSMGGVLIGIIVAAVIPSIVMGVLAIFCGKTYVRKK